ncbi:HupE/UreJ family protein [Deinococcus planocerae]|uniref:HupE/UreJ family protein n=1 Tax=Deinococcus planocerae TaxID=1737569 RepID=UPI001C63E358|nr:HupE/UreJ family protein [Deinococcus planocerae]
MTLPRSSLLTWLLALVFALLPEQAAAHPMPTTTMQLDLHTSSVTAELALPLNELQLATRWNLLGNSAALEQYGPQLRAYLLKHLAAATPSGQAWTVSVGTPTLTQAEQTMTGPYQEFVVPVRLTPPAGASTRTFTLKYDAIVHQVVTHSILVSIRQDWEQGLHGEHPVQVGVIRTDTRTGTVPPLEVNQAGGSAWQGFVGIFRLGMTHIAEGTDHLLFLLTLLLPAPLLAVMNRRPHWGPFGGTRRSLLNIVKITTAFTVGHSLTLLLGTLRVVNVPDQPIEALIAVSILVSAVHALRPIFPGREMVVAGGFGLIHGLAFSYTLAELNLSPWQTALSLLGFNLGIEAMQLLVIAVTMPWLILLAQTRLYPPVRVVGASLAVLASLGWLGDRVGLANPLGTLADSLGTVGPWALLGLAALAALGFAFQKLRNTEAPSA